MNWHEIFTWTVITVVSIIVAIIIAHDRTPKHGVPA